VLKQTGRDTDPPRIVFESPGDGAVTNRFSIRVTGRTEDDTYVSAISINGVELFIELARPRIAFDEEINLADGTNSIEVVVTDLIGRSTRQKITINADRQGPLVSLDKVELLGDPSHRRARVQGFVSDRSRIKRFLIGQTNVPVPPRSEWEFDRQVPLTAGSIPLPFEVEDIAGNTTMGQIPLSPTAARPPEIKPAKLKTPLWLCCTAMPPLTLVSAQIPFKSGIVRTAKTGNQAPPIIKIPGLAARQTVYVDTLYLEGQVTDDESVTAFSINGESIWQRPTRQMFFGHLVSLKPGDNHFVLIATDKGGNAVRQNFTVTYVIPEVKQLKSRLRVILFPFKKKGETSPLGKTVYDSLYNALVNQERFSLVERTELNKILRELKLSQTELVDPATAARVGKIAAADGMLLGAVTETPQALEVFARFVDVETSVVLAAVDVYGEDIKLSTLKTLMEGLAWKVRRFFPLVEGVILDIEGKVITIDLNSEHGIKEQMKLILFREGKKLKDLRTGKIWKKPAKRLGEARLTAVGDVDELSEASLLQSETADKLKELDKVITK
jgi:hypothetical protein